VKWGVEISELLCFGAKHRLQYQGASVPDNYVVFRAQGISNNLRL